VKSVYLLLFTLVTVGNGGSSQLNDTASQLVVTEVIVMAVDWLANFSNYGVMTELQESYKVIKSASRIPIRCFYDILTTS